MSQCEPGRASLQRERREQRWRWRTAGGAPWRPRAGGAATVHGETMVLFAVSSTLPEPERWLASGCTERRVQSFFFSRRRLSLSSPTFWLCSWLSLRQLSLGNLFWNHSSTQTSDWSITATIFVWFYFFILPRMDLFCRPARTRQEKLRRKKRNNGGDSSRLQMNTNYSCLVVLSLQCHTADLLVRGHWWTTLLLISTHLILFSRYLYLRSFL